MRGSHRSFKKVEADLVAALDRRRAKEARRKTMSKRQIRFADRLFFTANRPHLGAR